MDLGLNGKRALVTGSSAGIGRAIAEALAAEGAAVAVHGRDADRTAAAAETIRAAGGIAHETVGDLATDHGAHQVVTAAEEALGGVDILVNNAGGNEAAGGGLNGWFNDTPEIWLGTLQQNLISSVRLIHALAPAMRDRGWGRIVNVASGGASAPSTTVPAYCAAKAAVINLTVGLSIEFARTGVTVNTVSPGTTRTDGFEQRTLARLAEANGWPDGVDAREQAFMDLGIFPCSSARYGRPAEVGALVAFLASPIAGFVTGANYRIDGGQVQSVN